MYFYEASFKFEFINTKEKKVISLKTLGECVIDFLEHFGEENILGREFYSITGEGGGETKFSRLLEAAGYKESVYDFFHEILKQLEITNSDNVIPIKVGKILLPQLLVISILEILIPGNKFIVVKNVKQLEKLSNIKVPKDRRDDMQRVIDQFPVRLSLHTIRQMRISRAVAYQYMPFIEELNSEGMDHTWVGQFHRGIVEQMYENRVIFVMNMACPVYCRFCFRKHKECRNQKSPVQPHIKDAISYIKDSPSVKEIVLTGGDPFMNKATLRYAINGLREVPHIQTLRLATRSIAYYPNLFYSNDNFWLNYLKSKNLEFRQKGKRIEIATHFIHPDEISIESLNIISEFVKNGIPIYVQTPYLKDCNDKGDELVKLYNLLRGAGAEIHYIYIPCSPIRGNSVYWTPLSSGINTAAHLRANLSDRAMPGIVTATSIGKIDWNTSGWAVEPVKDDEKSIWIRTPYTREYYERFTPILQLSGLVRNNLEGTLDVKYMAKIGDKDLFLGSREPKYSRQVFPLNDDITRGAIDKKEELYHFFKSTSLNDQRFSHSIVETGCPSLFRNHKTRVEIHIDEDTDSAIDYISQDFNITDVILSSKNDIITSLYNTGKIIEKLQKINHINAIRLRSFKFNYEPELYTRAVLSKLENLNILRAANPKRLEIETQFLISKEFSPKHKDLTDELSRRGISVYNNTPLLSFVNDSDEEILNISYKCREIGIEFHHLYLAGMKMQKFWNNKYPVDIFKVTEIATILRKMGSGREIPAYIIRTELGEVDYGLTSKVVEIDEEGRIFLKLLPYKLEYYINMFPDFSWPDKVKIEEDGTPIIQVDGLKQIFTPAIYNKSLYNESLKEFSKFLAKS